MRYTFFSFDYDRDNWRASIVRNAYVCEGCVAKGYVDKAEWEEVKKDSDDDIKKWINRQLFGTSVTVVLIGKETYKSKWIKYEIEKSIKRGNGIIGIYIHRLKNQYEETDLKGENPLPSQYHTYDYVLDGGYNNIGDWIEKAYQEAK